MGKSGNFYNGKILEKSEKFVSQKSGYHMEYRIFVKSKEITANVYHWLNRVFKFLLFDKVCNSKQRNTRTN